MSLMFTTSRRCDIAGHNRQYFRQAQTSLPIIQPLPAIRE